MESIKNIENIVLDENDHFCSLHVTNLYGNMPLEDGTPGLFTVITEFYK
jgi:hypothetical protein